MPRLLVYWISRCDPSEMTAAWRAACALAEVQRFDQPAAELNALTHAEARLPDLIVLAQQRPGEYSAGEVESLRRALPLVRTVVVLGSWCEGETRTGKPWPGVIRLYGHHAAGQLTHELRQMHEGRSSTWSLPLSSSSDERLLEASSSTHGHVNCQGLIGICAANDALADTVAGICQTWGAATVALRPRQPHRTAGLSVVIWDVAGLGNALFDAVARREHQWLRTEFPSAAIIALLGFPRWQDAACAEQLQLAGLVSKPLVADDLWLQVSPWLRAPAALP